jgi:two-component system, chemotaxis family, sensor kinase CheA
VSGQNRRFISVGVKLALGTMLVVGLVSAVLALQFIERERTSLIAAKRTAAMMVADLFATGLSAPADFGDAEAMEAEVSRLAPNPDVSYAAVWLRGARAPSAELHAGSRARAQAPLVAGVTVTGEQVEVVRPIVGRGKSPLGHAVVVFSLARENAEYTAARGRIVLVAILLALGTSTGLLFLVRQLIVSPLAAVGRAARRLEHGDARAGVAVRANDEIGRLADAFNAMGAAIRDREARLARATRKLQDVLDNMGQAIIVFGPGGTIEGAPSRTSTRLFGAGRLEGRISDLLYPALRPSHAEVRAFAEWLELAFESDSWSPGEPAAGAAGAAEKEAAGRAAAADDTWETLAQLAPGEVVLPSGTILSLEFRRIPADDGGAPRVMLLATDVTDRRRLEQAVARGEEDHARQMAAMRRLIAGGGHLFVTFLEAAEERLARVTAALSGDGAASVDAIAAAFQEVHTIKSEARAFGLAELGAEANTMEELLSEALASARSGLDTPLAPLVEVLWPHLARARLALDRGRDLFVEASPIGHAALDQVTVSRGDLAALTAVVADADADPAAVRPLVERLSSRPFGESAESLVEPVPAWADQLGKSARVVIEGKACPVPHRLATHLSSILNQLARNAVAHAFEPRDARLQAGKPPTGTLTLSCHETEDGAVVRVEDDGAGFDQEALSARATALGLPAADATTAAFHAGVSTRTEPRGDLSGRGMGLGAVQALAARAGYLVTVTSRPGAGTVFTLRAAPAEGNT